MLYFSASFGFALVFVGTFVEFHSATDDEGLQK